MGTELGTAKAVDILGDCTSKTVKVLDKLDLELDAVSENGQTCIKAVRRVRDHLRSALEDLDIASHANHALFRSEGSAPLPLFDAQVDEVPTEEEPEDKSIDNVKAFERRQLQDALRKAGRELPLIRLQKFSTEQMKEAFEWAEATAAGDDLPMPKHVAAPVLEDLDPTDPSSFGEILAFAGVQGYEKDDLDWDKDDWEEALQWAEAVHRHDRGEAVEIPGLPSVLTPDAEIVDEALVFTADQLKPVHTLCLSAIASSEDVVVGLDAAELLEQVVLPWARREPDPVSEEFRSAFDLYDHDPNTPNPHDQENEPEKHEDWEEGVLLAAAEAGRQAYYQAEEGENPPETHPDHPRRQQAFLQGWDEAQHEEAVARSMEDEDGEAA